MSIISMRTIARCAAVVTSLTATPVAAQDSDWSLSLSGYLWMNATDLSSDTRFGRVDARLSFRDALDDLKFALMGTMEARNGPWGLVADLVYFNLSPKGKPPGPVFDSMTADTKVTVLSAYAVYRVHEDPTFALDIGAGVRAFSTDVGVTLEGPVTRKLGQSKSWVDPLVVARLRADFNDAWFGTLVLDAGGTNSTSSWQGLATIGYKVNDNWDLQGGYRYMRARWDTDFGRNKIEFSGPLIGATYRF